ISLQKFQQKALKQTKQKKSKSAEFLMVKEDTEATEGIGNPAFNMSRPDLSAYQTSEKKGIRHDMLTLITYCQDSYQPISTGNEYSRNYFDPPMDEEINPRQCGMEVSREGELELNIAPSQPLIADLNVCKEDNTAKLATLPEVTHESKGASGTCWKVEQSQSPQPFQIQMKCIRGIKNKAPQGSYLLQVSLLGRLGGCVLQWWQTEKLKTRTHPARHDGNFYDVGLYFHESLYVVLPPKKDVKPGMVFLFELFLLRGDYVCLDQAVGWAAFPLCDNNLDVVEGKFKCPLLRGHYDQKLNNFRKIEDVICLDLDHWLCNLYFQVIKLPLCFADQKTHARHTQLPPEFPVCLMAEAKEAESGLENTTGLSEKEKQKNICTPMHDEANASLYSSQGSISHKIGSRPMNCDLSLLKEDQELHNKGESLADHSVKETSTAWRTGEIEDYSYDISYLEELENHRFSVCCSSVADNPGRGEIFKHLHFLLVSVFSELQLAQWRSQGFWYIILLMASLWFLRLYLHYLSQWLFLQAISTPVTKFHFSPLTVELCYPPSSVHIREELLVVVMGPLMLNATILPLLLIRWGCQLLFAYCPDVLSKLIITMGLWTVLDPLAVFIVDIVLGRLTHDGDTPVADAAKLYWAFVRTMQSGIPGVILTVLIYILLFIISSLILYLYCLRLHSDSWILDALQRIHSEETKFFIPYDLEISNQELSYIVKRSEQWRGISGERRKVAVYDYIWKSHGVKSSLSSCDLQHLNEISVSARGPGDITSHVSIYTVYPSGFQELYRHFLRLPGGAIVEVFGDISGLKFIPSEVVTAIQKHISEMDSTLEDTFDMRSREMKRIH
uniref:Orofacial cleft 1 candidate gene 1 protein n=1 Tax=Rhinolophus ferrumequinum TaxID=59479 RepID=A0A671FQK5_RHIFE